MLLQRTALYLACEKGHAKCVEVLLKGGAKVTYSIIDYNQEQGNSSEDEDYRKNIKSCLGIAILRLKRFEIHYYYVFMGVGMCVCGEGGGACMVPWI